MKKISVVTNYWLFKPHEISSTHYEYYYVRIVNELLPENVAWMQGYVNHHGGVSTVGPPISDERCASLEAEFQDEINRTVDDCVYYNEAQGRHLCHNPVVKTEKCNGVCNEFTDI